jgi:hypothetical protein
VLGGVWRGSVRPLPESAALGRGLGGFHVALLILLYLLGGYIDRRHLLPLAALVVPWAACGLICVSDRMGQWASARGREWSPRTLIAGLLLGLVAVMLPRSLRPLHEPYRPQLAAAEWIKRRTTDRETVIANSPYVGFYAERPTDVYGWKEYAQPTALLQRLRAADARYVVLDTGATEHFDPSWLPTLEAHYALVRRIEGTGRARRHTVLIYEPTRIAARTRSL